MSRFECGIIIDGLEEVKMNGPREDAIRDLVHYLYQYKDNFKKTLVVYIMPEQDDDDE